MNLLISYLTDRAKEEGVKMLLDETFLINIIELDAEHFLVLL